MSNRNKKLPIKDRSPEEIKKIIEKSRVSHKEAVKEAIKVIGEHRAAIKELARR